MKPRIAHRWHAHGLDAPRFGSGADVVRHLGAVQSQLHDMALWSLGRRCGRTFDELCAEAGNLAFRRTHVLRPTWHFVDLADLAWMQQVSGERVERLSLTTLKASGVTPAAVDRAVDTIRAIVADGAAHPRDDLRAALEAAGVDTSGQLMAHYAMHAEVRLVVASGPPSGKQQTYLALPGLASPFTPDAALAELAIRYGRGHGAFRPKDLAWWSSITLTTARRAIDLAGLVLATIDGEQYALPLEPLVDVPPPAAALLSNFDEYISYARDDADHARIPGGVQEVMRSTGLLLLDGALSGTWRRTLRSASVLVEVIPATALTAPARHAVEADAAAFAEFLGRTLDLTVAGA